MSLFLNLYLGHLLGDFVLQPGGLVTAKREGLRGQLAHVGILAVTTGLALLGRLREAWAALVIATLAHLIIERLTIAARDRLAARGLFVFVFDQSLHVLSLLVIAWVFEGLDWSARAISFGVRLPTQVLAAACGLLTVSFMGSILVFETTRALIPPQIPDDGILRWDLRRVLGLLERSSAFTLAVAVHPLGVVVPFVPRVVMALLSAPQRRAIRMIEAVAGLALTTLAYVVFLAASTV